WFTGRRSYSHFLRKFPVIAPDSAPKRCDFLYFDLERCPHFVNVSPMIRLASTKLFVQCGSAPFLWMLGFWTVDPSEIERKIRFVWLRRASVVLLLASLYLYGQVASPTP